MAPCNPNRHCVCVVCHCKLCRLFNLKLLAPPSDILMATLVPQGLVNWAKEFRPSSVKKSVVEALEKRGEILLVVLLM
ncbi:hypothetical protein GUJ93_ZPchr0002g26020 [Zizania palustris]|uniref:Uncharacterized protein n=1 Tax=Zizania palustris TaxID=103762 RepID=A0A8J5V5I0_ZIZPA|nr:hypothetical protein GUJ93_ZPchr0002g26020 [Zizania palustris]